jgi:cyclopropane-fatty-acyl-phospholipid synthase
LNDLAEIRLADYRGIGRETFDAISSVGFMEHVGGGTLGEYFSYIVARLRPGGRVLNHCIVRPEGGPSRGRRRTFIDRYIFPDGELTSLGRIIGGFEAAGLEVEHEENLRLHYGRTCAAWSENLVRNWEACVSEVGDTRARAWGLYIAGSRIGFERNGIQVHQVLAVKLPGEGTVERTGPNYWREAGPAA